MELYTKRYNLYNYLIRDDFDYNSTREYIYIWRNLLIILFALLIGSFIYHFNNIDLFGIFIILIILLFVYIIYFEITIYISDLVNNKHLINYKNYYEVMNSLFTENFDFTKDDDINDNKITITTPSVLLSISPDILSKYQEASIDREYFQFKIDNDNYFNDFLRNNFYLYESIINDNNIYITVDDILLENKRVKVDNLFIKSSGEYKYLSSITPEVNQKYFIKDNYFKFTISNDPLKEEYYNLKYHIIEKMYYLFIKQLNDGNNPNTSIENDKYVITVNDINLKNDKLISNINILKSSRTFKSLTFENSEIYKYNSINNTLELVIIDKRGFFDYIKANQYYDYSGSVFTDNDYTSDIIPFLNSISYDGIYENTGEELKIKINTNDNFYNDMYQDYDSYKNYYAITNGTPFIDVNTNDIFVEKGILYFNIAKFYNKYLDIYTNVNPDIKTIPIIAQSYNLYILQSLYKHTFRVSYPDTIVPRIPEPVYDSQEGIATFKIGSYITIPKDRFNTTTISFWFKTTDNRTLLEFVNIDNTVKFRIKKNNNDIIFDINIGSGDKKKKYSITAPNLDFNEWHNVVIIIDVSNKEKSKVSLYIDSKSIETKELFFFLIALAIAGGIAGSRKQESSYEDLNFTDTKMGDFNGQMKDFRIYYKILSDEDIKNLYKFQKGIQIDNDFIRKYKDIYIDTYSRTSDIIKISGGKLIINKRRINELTGKSLNVYLTKIKEKIGLFDTYDRTIIQKKTSIKGEIERKSQIKLIISMSKINDTTINEYRNSFIRNIIFNKMIPFINEKTRKDTIDEIIEGIKTKNGIYLKLNYKNIYNNRDKLETENTYIYELLQTIIKDRDFDNNNNYWETIDKIPKNGKIYLRIKTDEKNFKVENLNKRAYFKKYIYQLIEAINNGERFKNKFLEKLSKDGNEETFKILLSYYKIRHKIKANIRFIENKSYDEINFINYRKDILKFIDIYNDIDIKTIKNYLFIREDAKIPNVKSYPDDRKVYLKTDEMKLNELIKEVTISEEPFKYYLINLEQLNKIDVKESNFDFMKDFIIYMNDIYDLKIKDLNDFYGSIDVKQNDEITKIIDNYNSLYIKILIVILILVTIIFHVFYQEFIKYVR